MDPDIGAPAIIGNSQYLSDGSPAMTPEMQSFSVLALEPDQSHTRVVRAWLTTNMIPKRTGDIIGRREMQGSQEADDVNIEFTGTTRVGRGVNEFAVRYLKSLAMRDVRPYDMRAAYTEFNSDLTDNQESYKRNITEAVLR
jgi:F0F1-type ATP synthase alpha subunit